MNIFVLDNNVELSAQYHCDKHVVKMILETAQLLCSAHEPGVAPYRRTHYNHPCSKWVRTTTGNYLWLADFGLALCREYTHRYGKRHKSQDVIEWAEESIPDSIPLGDLTPFAQAMPDQFKHVNTVLAYRRYYNNKQIDMRYTNREAPQWLSY